MSHHSVGGSFPNGSANPPSNQQLQPQRMGDFVRYPGGQPPQQSQPPAESGPAAYYPNQNNHHYQQQQQHQQQQQQHRHHSHPADFPNENENVNTQLVPHGQRGPSPSNLTQAPHQRNAASMMRSASVTPVAKQPNYASDLNSGMQLLQTKLSSEYEIRRKLLEMEAAHARLSQDIKDDHQRIGEIERECDKLQETISATQEKMDINRQLLAEWAAVGQSTLRKRLDTLKRESGPATDRKTASIFQLDQKTHNVIVQNDLISEWLATTLPQRVAESAGDLLAKISRIERDLAQYKAKNHALMTISHDLFLGDAGATMTTSLSSQKQHVARLRKTLEDLKLEMSPWLESLHRTQQNLLPLRNYPLVLANALLESKIPPPERREYRQKTALKYGTTIADLTTVLSTDPFQSDIQLVDIQLAPQSPLGRLRFPTDTEVRVNQKLFDFNLAIQRWLDPSQRTDLGPAGARGGDIGDEDDNDDSKLPESQDVFDQIFGIVRSADEQSSALLPMVDPGDETETIEVETPISSQIERENAATGTNQFQNTDLELPATVSTTALTTPNIDHIGSYDSSTNQSPAVPLTPAQAKTLARQKTLILPPVAVSFPETSSTALQNPFFLWINDLSVYLIPTWNNASRLLHKLSELPSPAVHEQPLASPLVQQSRNHPGGHGSGTDFGNLADVEDLAQSESHSPNHFPGSRNQVGSNQFGYQFYADSRHTPQHQHQHHQHQPHRQQPGTFQHLPHPHHPQAFDSSHPPGQSFDQEAHDCQRGLWPHNHSRDALIGSPSQPPQQFRSTPGDAQWTRPSNRLVSRPEEYPQSSGQDSTFGAPQPGSWDDRQADQALPASNAMGSDSPLPHPGRDESADIPTGQFSGPPPPGSFRKDTDW